MFLLVFFNVIKAQSGQLLEESILVQNIVGLVNQIYKTALEIFRGKSRHNVIYFRIRYINKKR